MEPPAKRPRLVSDTDRNSSQSAGASQLYHNPSQPENHFRASGVQNTGNWEVGRDVIIYNSQQPNANTADDQRRALLESLRFDQMDARQLNIKRTHAHTCVWFLNTPEYVNWTQRNTMHDNHNFLWIKGKPGAGKSTLMKFLFGRLSDRVEQAKNQEVLLSFFFNARGDDLEKTTAGLYRSLLLQLLKARPDLQFVLDNARIGHRWTVESLKNLFGEAIRKLGNTSLIFLIDALDECEEEQIRDMVFFLSDPDIIQHQHRICFASRHYPHITVPTARSIVLEAQSGHSEDIASYVNRYLVIEDSSLAEQIRCDLQEKASGVFMWVVLVVGILNKDYDEGRGPVLRTRIQELPKDLHDLFFDILTRDKNNMDNLLLCIQWILFAWKPLTPEQLYFAIISGREPDNLQRYHSGDAFGYDMNKYILSSSKGLAESTKSSKPTVQFIHESVRDFLLKDGGLNRLWPDLRTNVPGLSHDRLKQCCQTYMCMREVQDPKGFGPKAITSAFPFLDYAHQGILYHADQAQRHHVSQREFLTTFPRSQWVKHHNILSVLMNCYTPEVTLLYILAETGMAALIRAQPNRQSCFEVENERYGVPALAASATKSSEAIQTMLDLEAERLSETSLANLYSLMPPSLDIKYPSGRNFTFKKAEDLWHQLIEYGNEKLLLFFFSAEGCDIHVKNAQGRSPLMLAAEKGFSILVDILLRKGADISATDGYGWSPLYIASRYGHVEAVNLLIDRGADISAADPDGQSPLYIALRYGHVKAAKLLIDRGADVLAADKYRQSPLYFASYYGNVEAAKLLIDRGANISAANKYKRSPLYIALYKGHVEAAKLLINRGADISATDKYGESPLCIALRNGYVKAAKLLINRGADISATNKYGESPLYIALYNGYVKAAKLLINRGADISAANKNGQSPLYIASRFERVKAAKLLIDRGADISATDNNGQSPLYIASCNGCVKAAKLLIDRGADISATNKDGKSPLYTAATCGQVEMVKLLIHHGANISATNKDGKSPLYAAATCGQVEMAKLLIHHGADVSATNKDGKSPLYVAATHGYVKMVKLLIHHGADVSATNKDGKSPLYVAATHGHVEMVKLLIHHGADVSVVKQLGQKLVSLRPDWVDEDEVTEVVELLRDCDP